MADKPERDAQPSGEPKPPALDWARVYQFADKLEHGDSRSVGQTMTQVDQYVSYDPNGQANKDVFIDALTVTLQRDRMLGKVMSDFSQSSFTDQYGEQVKMYDFLRRGNHRISTDNLIDDTIDLNAHHRAFEARLTQEMQGAQTTIENAHYEGAFLGIGGPVSGIDQKRLNNNAKNETKTRESENMLTLFGIDSTGYVHHTSSFNEISHGKAYITKEDLQQTLLDAAQNGGYSAETITTLQYMRDNIKKFSETDVNPYNPDERGITVKKIMKYAQKNHANLDLGDSA